jgi:pimeloyl-ACP methyl ester carboxylesterase
MSDSLTLETFTDDLVNHILFEGLNEVVLVGHSFGGNAVSGAAERIPERISSLIYLDCTIVRGGKRLIDSLSPGKLSERLSAIDTSENGVSVDPPSSKVFGVLKPADQAWVEARLTPHPISTMISPLPIEGPPGNGLSARYIACTDPLYHPTERVQGWASEFGWHVDEIPTGHDAMVTAPDALVELLDR